MKLTLIMVQYSQLAHTLTLCKVLCSGRSIGKGPGVPGPPLFWVKKEQMTEGRKASPLPPP